MKKSRKGRGETRAILNHLTTYRVSQITLQNCNQDKKWRVVHVQIMHQFFLHTTYRVFQNYTVAKSVSSPFFPPSCAPIPENR